MEMANSGNIRMEKGDLIRTRGEEGGREVK